MPVLAIPALNVPAGHRVFGPLPVSTQWNQITLDLEASQLTQPCSILVEIAPDGVNFELVVAATFTGPGSNHDGTPRTNIGLSFELGDWLDPDGQIRRHHRTDPSAQWRITIDNTAPWHTDGGTLTVEDVEDT
jgi:hypothetical protein